MGNSEIGAEVGQQSISRSRKKINKSVLRFVEDLEVEDEDEEILEFEELEDEIEEGQQPEEADEDGDGSILVKLVDQSVLNCRYCLDALDIPVFQCVNGHAICSRCSKRVKQKCPACSKKIKSEPCRAIEDVLDAVKAHCSNKRYGCPIELLYSSKRAHEAKCAHAPFDCPFDGCRFVGCQNRLSSHLNNSHTRSILHLSFGKALQFTMSKTEKFVVFREEAKGTIFFLNKCNNVALSCIDGSDDEDSFAYVLFVRGKDSCVMLQSLTSRFKSTSTGGCGASFGPTKDFIELPSYLFGEDGSLKFELCVWRKGAPSVDIAKVALGESH